MNGGEKLKPGSFYWVKPVFDVDFIPPGWEGKEYSEAIFEAMWGHWSQREQPARFIGYDEGSQEKWLFLGQEEDSENYWPVCWIGPEMVVPLGQDEQASMK